MKSKSQFLMQKIMSTFIIDGGLYFKQDNELHKSFR